MDSDLEIHEVIQVERGFLYVMPRPAANHLPKQVGQLADLGIDLVESLLTNEELAILGIAEEPQLLRAVGIEFLSLPIRDMGIPDTSEFEAFVCSIYQELFNGKNVAIHCRAGIGRTGLLASCLLIEDGVSSDAAMAMVSAARGVRVPESSEQIVFVHEFYSTRTRWIIPSPKLLLVVEKGNENNL